MIKKFKIIYETTMTVIPTEKNNIDRINVFMNYISSLFPQDSEMVGMIRITMDGFVHTTE